jgi:hypothetical protein
MADQRDHSSSWYAPPTAPMRPGQHPGFPPRSTHAPRHGAAGSRHDTRELWLRPDTTGRIPKRTRTRRRLDANGWHWLLWLPVVVPLWPGLYNRIHPTLGGLPFYYWGQLAFALLASAVIATVHMATKDR